MRMRVDSALVGAIRRVVSTSSSSSSSSSSSTGPAGVDVDGDDALRSWDAHWDGGCIADVVVGDVPSAPDAPSAGVGGSGGAGVVAAGSATHVVVVVPDGGDGRILDPRVALGTFLSADLIVGFHP